MLLTADDDDPDGDGDEEKEEEDEEEEDEEQAFGVHISKENYPGHLRGHCFVRA